jgi:hypothetical protein
MTQVAPIWALVLAPNPALFATGKAFFDNDLHIDMP